jgi:hypothetical protein
MFYFTFDCYHLNQARTRTLSVLRGPGPSIGPREGPVKTSMLLFVKHRTTVHRLVNISVDACLRAASVVKLFSKFLLTNKN